MNKIRSLGIWTLLATPVILAVIFVCIAIGLARGKRQAKSTDCANAVISISSALRLWAAEHRGMLPGSLNLASNELVMPKILVCPADRKTTTASSWATLTATNSSYELSPTDSDLKNTDTVILRCRIHGHLGYLDGTVFDGTRRRAKSFF